MKRPTRTELALVKHIKALHGQRKCLSEEIQSLRIRDEALAGVIRQLQTEVDQLQRSRGAA